MGKATVWAPVLAAAFGVAWFAATMRSPTEPAGEMQVSKFGRLPVLEGGRVKPIDSYATQQLYKLANRGEYYQEEKDSKDKVVGKTRRSATHWLLGLLARGYGFSQEPQPIMVPPIAQQWLGLRPRRGHLYEAEEILQAAQDKGPALNKLLTGDPAKLEPIEKVVLAVLQEVKDQPRPNKDLTKFGEKNSLPEDARVFRIENDQITALLGLERIEGLRYTYKEVLLSKGFADLRKKAEKADEVPEKERDLEDAKALELLGKVMTNDSLLRLGGPVGEDRRGSLKIVPGLTDDLEGWKTLAEALRDGDAEGPEANPSARAMRAIVEAYAVGDVSAFNKAVDSFASALNAKYPAQMARVRTEAWFNHFAPFYQCLLLYVVVLLLAIGSWVGWHEPLRRSAFALALVVWVVHTLALVARIYLTQRPPVTNLYSSAVFIGWGCVALCLVLEWVASRNRFAHSIPLVVAAVLGFATMIVAHHLASSGDSMQVMQAVLDTNFWLATHVTTVTLGYTATFVAGFVAATYVFMMLATAVRSYFTTREPLAGAELRWFVASVCGLVAIPCGVAAVVLGGLFMLFTDGEPLDAGTILVLSIPAVAAGGFYAALTVARRLSPEYVNGSEVPRVAHVVDALALRQDTGKVLTTLVYGVICFATLLSFVGTVLGGIWADQSWGRFWGWDPKENGALLIVVMNAMILHARWAGLVKERGVCVLAIVGNMVTAWSWFGTNQLGVGLHAYGFNNTLAFGCTVFWFSQLGLAGLGLMPLRFWRAYADKPLAGPAPVLKGAPKGPRLQSGGSTGIQPA
jgi:ABC-type transport system involved in cytochrome c biogenesis permease subunit